MKNKMQKLSKICIYASAAALLGMLICFFVLKGSAGFAELGKIFMYILNFAFTRDWDSKKIIVLSLAGVILIVWLIWVIVGKVKTNGKMSIFEPTFVFFIPLVALLAYHSRHLITGTLGENDVSRRIACIILLVFTGLFILGTLLSVIFGVAKTVDTIEEIKEQPKRHVEPVEEVVAEDNCQCECCKHDEDDELCSADNELIKDNNEYIHKIYDIVSSPEGKTRKVLVKRIITEEAVDEEQPQPNASIIPPHEEPAKEEVPADTSSIPVILTAPVIEEPVKVKKVIIRKPFNEKMAKASDENKENYDILKNELLSYGVKSRLSHGGDTFRLKRESYALITLVGKNLKLYLALNPSNYEDTTIPARDESGKKRYSEVPTMIRIKSKLSVKRAKMLIAELMAGKNLAQKEVGEVKYSKEFKASKPRKAKAK